MQVGSGPLRRHPGLIIPGRSLEHHQADGAKAVYLWLRQVVELDKLNACGRARPEDDIVLMRSGVSQHGPHQMPQLMQRAVTVESIRQFLALEVGEGDVKGFDSHAGESVQEVERLLYIRFRRHLTGLVVRFTDHVCARPTELGVRKAVWASSGSRSAACLEAAAGERAANDRRAV